MNLVAVRNPFGSLERELEHMLSDWQDPFEAPFFGPNAGTRGFTPAIDFEEDEDGFRVRVELPGVDKKDVDINVHERVLTIKGQKQLEREEKKGGKVLRRESWAGGFERAIRLPESADTESVKAEMKDGVLILDLKKKIEAKPRSIAING